MKNQLDEMENIEISPEAQYWSQNIGLVQNDGLINCHDYRYLTFILLK